MLNRLVIFFIIDASLCFRFGKMMSLLWCFDSRPYLDLKRDRNQELLDGRPGVRSSANYRDEGCIQLVSSASSVAFPAQASSPGAAFGRNACADSALNIIADFISSLFMPKRKF